MLSAAVIWGVTCYNLDFWSPTHHRQAVQFPRCCNAGGPFVAATVLHQFDECGCQTLIVPSRGCTPSVTSGYSECLISDCWKGYFSACFHCEALRVYWVHTIHDSNYPCQDSVLWGFPPPPSFSLLRQKRNADPFTSVCTPEIYLRRGTVSRSRNAPNLLCTSDVQRPRWLRLRVWPFSCLQIGDLPHEHSMVFSTYGDCILAACTPPHARHMRGMPSEHIVACIHPLVTVGVYPSDAKALSAPDTAARLPAK